MLGSHNTWEGEKGQTLLGQLPLEIAIFTASLELVSLVVLQSDMYEETCHQAGGPVRLYLDAANKVSCLLLL